ncbi:MAG: glycosyltransferase family 2 protein, partial [Caulobacteraceae bacterium]
GSPPCRLMASIEHMAVDMRTARAAATPDEHTAAEWGGPSRWPARSLPVAGAKRISCVVCAYNEEDRIRDILDAVNGHPALAEVIVVNDGSTDRTEALLAAYPGVRVISYAPNRGKTYALSRGIAAAAHDHLMLLDADLSGVTAADIAALAAPVIDGEAEVSLSLRRNSLGIYRRMGLDFVSGERVIPRRLLAEAIGEMQRLPRWGGEAFMNDRIIAAGFGVAVVEWPAVFNVRKYSKLGHWRGLLSEIAMMRDALRVLSPWGVVRQNFGLLRRINAHPALAAARRPQSDVSFDISFVKYFLIR